MKQLAVAVFLIVMRGLAFAEAMSDHLTPVDLNEDPRYRALLIEKLSATPFDCGRVIIKPPFRYGEESISIYSQATNGADRRYYVTYISAADSLRDWSDVGQVPERANKVKISRIDADIPPPIGRLLSEVWTRMLSGRQAPRQLEQATDIFYGDATIAEFLIESDTKGILYGETMIVPDIGTKTKQFVELSQMLVSYCKAEPAERKAFLARIDRQATQLLKKLDR